MIAAGADKTSSQRVCVSTRTGERENTAVVFELLLRDCTRGRLDRRFNDWNTPRGEEARAPGSPNNLICIKHSYRPYNLPSTLPGPCKIVKMPEIYLDNGGPCNLESVPRRCSSDRRSLYAESPMLPSIDSPYQVNSTEPVRRVFFKRSDSLEFNCKDRLLWLCLVCFGFNVSWNMTRMKVWMSTWWFVRQVLLLW